MKKLISLVLLAVMSIAMFAGCSGNVAPSEEKTAYIGNKVNLYDMYTVTDPEGVEYDQRIALYAPVLESDDAYASGQRDLFVVFYGKDDQGVYMYTVMIFDTEANAAAFAAEKGYTADGKAVINTSDATFFAAMSSFIPNFQTWIDNNKQSGMIELD